MIPLFCNLTLNAAGHVYPMGYQGAPAVYLLCFVIITVLLLLLQSSLTLLKLPLAACHSRLS